MRRRQTTPILLPRPLSILYCAMAACSSTLEAQLMERGGIAATAEMELLKDLPSYDSQNFSKFCQGSWKSEGKPYLRLKNGTEGHALEILTDTTSLLLRDLERDVRKNETSPLKRRAARDDISRKVPRLDPDSDSSLD